MAEPCRLRSIVRADIAALARLERAAFDDPWTTEQLANAMDWPGTVALLVEDDTGLIGYVLGRVVVDEAEILSLATIPARRREGIGNRLLLAALETMRGKGAHAVWLEVRVSNVAARALYQAAGFIPAGLRRDYYRQPVEDAIILRSELSAPTGTALR